MNSKHFFFRVSLFNLALVALLGFILRIKILFELPFIDYRNLLSGHSHFAFVGWASLMLLTLLVYHFLPPDSNLQRKFGAMLVATSFCGYGMLIAFPIQGYAAMSIFFSSAFIVVTYVFAFRYLPLLKRMTTARVVRVLLFTALGSLLLSAAGPILLGYIMASGSTNSLLYRDAIYGFLHFQYNGFFSLAVMAHFLHRAAAQEALPPVAKQFGVALAASVVPTLFLSLFWHNQPLLYILGAAGVLLLLLALVSFLRLWKSIGLANSFRQPLARKIVRLAFAAFCLKMLLQAATIVPRLANAVYGDRSVIIGFLHLVLLGFISLYLLALLIEEGYFTGSSKAAYPVYIFVTGVFLNEALLMLQGLGILLGSYSRAFNWGLLFAAATLFIGATAMAAQAIRNRHSRT